MEIQTQTIKPMVLTTPASSPTTIRSGSTVSTDSSSTVSERAKAEPQAVNEVQLKGAIEAANEFMKPINSAVQFSLDKESGATVVRVMDTSTKEVIRQIPSEEMLAIAKALDQIQGMLIKQKA